MGTQSSSLKRYALTRLALVVPMVFILLTLVFLNVALGALNLIPANPLDGYKVVVGLIWSLIGTESSARRLIRRVASAWLVVEAVCACFLLVERPALGSAVVLMAASLYSQKLFARRSRA